MQAITHTPQKDILNTQNSTEENHTNNSNSNYEREQIENTPFWVIGTQEEGYNLIMGKWKLTTTPHKTKNDLKLWMNKNKWNLILTMIICATQDIHDQNKETYPRNKFDHDPLTDDITPKL